MKVITKWQIHLLFDDKTEKTIWLYDDIYSNILRKLADIQFTSTGLVQPTHIHITQDRLT